MIDKIDTYYMECLTTIHLKNAWILIFNSLSEGDAD